MVVVLAMVVVLVPLTRTTCRQIDQLQERASTGEAVLHAYHDNHPLICTQKGVYSSILLSLLARAPF